MLLFITPAFAQSPSADVNGACWDYGTWYQNQSADWNLRGYGNSLGANINDFDGDGHLDLFIAMAPSRADGAVSYPGESLLYLQREGRFVEEGNSWGVDDLCEDRAPLFGDLDNDGWVDLYLTVNGRNALYRGRGGVFEDVTAWSGAAGHPGWGHQGFLLDFDGDGFLDVFFTNGPEDGSGLNVLLHNQRDGTFWDATDHAGVAGSPSGKGTCVLDANDDGWLDIFVTTGRNHQNQLFINQGDGTFADEAHQRGVSDPLGRFGVGANCGDLDGDGDEDILVITHDKTWTGNQLFENRDGVFVDVAPDSDDGLSVPSLMERVDPHGSALVDLNNDGLLDAVLSGFSFQPHVYLNTGDLRFERLCEGAGIQADDLLSWGVVSADLTDDGYPEVVITNGLGLRPRDDELFAYVGPSDNRWLGIDVVGTQGNPSAIGALVEVATEQQTITRRVGGWSNFDSQGPLRVLTGLGAETEATATVTFLSGESVSTSVSSNQVITLVEPESDPDADRDGVPDDWDVCANTPTGALTDAEGCAGSQRGAPAISLISPAPDEVITDCFTFTWTSDGHDSAVLQVSADGTFGPTARTDFGPITGDTFEVCGDALAELQSTSDGTTPMIWRVAVSGDQGQGTSPPSAFYVALPIPSVTIPQGANIFEPAHVVVDAGDTVTWWNDGVSNGNLQNEPHDVQLLNESGVTLTHMHELEGAGVFNHTFGDPGVWHYICHRHSGVAQQGDVVSETTQFQHPRTDGPYRCMSGTVTVR